MRSRNPRVTLQFSLPHTAYKEQACTFCIERIMFNCVRYLHSVQWYVPKDAGPACWKQTPVYCRGFPAASVALLQEAFANFQSAVRSYNHWQVEKLRRPPFEYIWCFCLTACAGASTCISACSSRQASRRLLTEQAHESKCLRTVLCRKLSWACYQCPRSYQAYVRLTRTNA